MQTNERFQRMVEDIKERVGADEEPGVLEDIATHSADAGWGGFTYTSECVEFYEAHKDVIWEMLSEDADNMGYSNAMEMVGNFARSDMLDDEDSFKNLLAWYALEEVSRRLVDEGEHIPECEECCGILEDDGTCADCDAEEDEPEPGDIVVSDAGPLGSRYQVNVVEGDSQDREHFKGELSSWREVVDSIISYHVKFGVYPNVWRESDHGNLETLEGWRDE